MNKQELFLQDLIIPHHKDFKNKSEIAKLAKKNPNAFSIETLFEQTFNNMTGFTQAKCDDHHDAIKGNFKIEYKTSCVLPNPQFKLAPHSYGIKISACRSQAGIVKQASLVVGIHNPHENRLDYFFIPETEVGGLVNYGNSINGTYNTRKKEYAPKIEKYRIPFKDLVKKLKKL